MGSAWFPRRSFRFLRSIYRFLISLRFEQIDPPTETLEKNSKAVNSHQFFYKISAQSWLNIRRENNAKTIRANTKWRTAAS